MLKNLQQMQQKLLQKREIQQTPEATDNLTGNKIADIITSVLKKSWQNSSKELHSKTDENEMEIPK